MRVADVGPSHRRHSCTAWASK